MLKNTPSPDDIYNAIMEQGLILDLKNLSELSNDMSVWQKHSPGNPWAWGKNNQLCIPTSVGRIYYTRVCLEHKAIYIHRSPIHGDNRVFLLDNPNIQKGDEKKWDYLMTIFENAQKSILVQ